MATNNKKEAKVTQSNENVKKRNLKTDFDFNGDWNQPEWFVDGESNYDQAGFEHTAEFVQGTKNLKAATKERKQSIQPPTKEEINKKRIKMTRKFQVDYAHMKRTNDKSNKKLQATNEILTFMDNEKK